MQIRLGLCAWLIAGLLPMVVLADVPAARQQALRHLLAQDCGSCHGLTLQGGPGPALRGVSAPLAGCLLVLAGCATPRGTGDLGLVIERAAGRVQVVNTSQPRSLATIAGLGDLSHASLVYSRDARYAYVFGRDGGLTKVDLLCRRIGKRVLQAGNAIGGGGPPGGEGVARGEHHPG